MNLQPNEVTMNVSSEVEQSSGVQDVPMWEVSRYTSDDSWFGNGQGYIREINASSIVGHAKLFNATIKSYTVVHGACMGVSRNYKFRANDTRYEFEQYYYPSGQSVIGYDVASIEKWPMVLFKTDVFSIVLLHLVAAFFLFIFWLFGAFGG
jgi:hypothetical protein